MSAPPHIAVVIPVFNHALTVGRVVRESRAVLPVIVVNDGSTDRTPAILAEEEDIVLLTLQGNQGKAAALREGLTKAMELGFSHVITLDADGQHPTAALPEFAAACQRQPVAFIIGSRDLKQARAPWARQVTNKLSSFWFRIETGLSLPDTQCGYRCYPLAAVRELHPAAQRYAWELEILVKAAWAGFPLVPRPVSVDYLAPTSRMSHFDPWRDLAQITWLHARLTAQALGKRAALRGGPRRRVNSPAATACPHCAPPSP
jgi:glycosyltransferase involved in cell wall biosynthesis